MQKIMDIKHKIIGIFSYYILPLFKRFIFKSSHVK